MNQPANNRSLFATNQCPSCAAEIKADSEVLFGDKECPSCEKKLWYLTAADSARFFESETSEDLQQQAISFIAERMEVDRDDLVANPNILSDVETDSLEALEMLMDLEEKLGLV